MDFEENMHNNKKDNEPGKTYDESLFADLPYTTMSNRKFSFHFKKSGKLHLYLLNFFLTE